MKKIVLSLALIAAVGLGSAVYAQAPAKKEAKKEQAAPEKKDEKKSDDKKCCKKTSCADKAEKPCAGKKSK